MSVIADIVINHNSGADAAGGQSAHRPIALDAASSPRAASSRATGNAFHPNMYESWDEMTFGDMPDLSHRNPYVYAELLKLARWLIEEVGFDGFRYDFVKGYGANTITAIQEYHYMRDGKPFQPYGVAEFWDNARAIENWVDLANFSNSNPVDAFDFPLREMLKALCDQYGFSLRNLATWETVAAEAAAVGRDLRREPRPARRGPAHRQRQAAGLQLHPDARGLSLRLLAGLLQLQPGPARIRPTASPRWCRPTRNTPAAQPRPCISTTTCTSCSAPATATSPG